MEGGTSRCIEMVNRAKALTQTSIMFVPTLFWVNEEQASLSSVNQQVHNPFAGFAGSAAALALL